MFDYLPHNERQYLLLLDDIRENGVTRGDRTGTGTRSIFAPSPLVIEGDHWCLPLTKRLFTRGVIAELCWFLSGDTNVRALQAQGVRIWDEWADANGDLGPVYGAQLVEQWEGFLHGIKHNPLSRRHILTTWNHRVVEHCALPPCHGLVSQAYVAGGKLHWYTFQRSADAFLGLPFNLFSYQLFQRLACEYAGLRPGRLTYALGDAHIYNNHEKQVDIQLGRWHSLENVGGLERTTPRVTFTGDPLAPQPHDFTVSNYNPLPTIKAEVSV